MKYTKVKNKVIKLKCTTLIGLPTFEYSDKMPIISEKQNNK